MSRRALRNIEAAVWGWPLSRGSLVYWVGSVDVSSDVGVGSIFTVILPFDEGESGCWVNRNSDIPPLRH